MDENNIFEKFRKWTEGLGPKEARISVFEHVRDIPYAIVPELRSPERGPSGIITLNKGSCQPKHYLLAKLFKELNIPVKYATYPFRWGDCPIKYPPGLKKSLKGLPLAYHLACKAFINGKWVLVDATWDATLKKFGFPVNENWDGSNDTLNAVVPQKEVLHETPGGRVDYETEKKARQTEKEKASYAEFVDKLNAWLDKIRKA